MSKLRTLNPEVILEYNEALPVKEKLSEQQLDILLHICKAVAKKEKEQEKRKTFDTYIAILSGKITVNKAEEPGLLNL